MDNGTSSPAIAAPDLPGDAVGRISGKNQRLIFSALSQHPRLSMLQLTQATGIDRRSLLSSLTHAISRGSVASATVSGVTLYELTSAGRAQAAGVPLPPINPVTKPAHLRGGTNSGREFVMQKLPARSVFDL